MEIAAVMNCIRPVCFENDHVDFPYSIRGSSCLIRYKQRLYAITAKHVTADWQDDQVLIPYRFGSAHFFPIGSRVEIRTDELEDTDHTDFVVYEVWEEELVTEEFDPSCVYAISPWVDARDRYRTLLVAGFPQADTFVDYDAKKIVYQPYYIEAEYAGSAGLGVSRLDFKSTARLPDFDGLSGSPVFGFYNDGTSVKSEFRGVMIRATVVSGSGRFIDAKVIQHVLDRHDAERLLHSS